MRNSRGRPVTTAISIPTSNTWCSHSLTHSLTYSFTHLLAYLLTYSLTQSVTGAPVRSSIFSSCVGVLITSSFVLIFGEAAAQNILVTAALMPAVLGYMVLLQCIVEIRSIEGSTTSNHSLTHSLTYLLTAAHNPGQFTNRQLTQLGHEPGKMRFFYGAFGAKVAQWMCGLLAFALCVLAGVSNDFMIGAHSLTHSPIHSLTYLHALLGLIIVGVLGIIGYYGMTYSISDDSDAEGSVCILLTHSLTHSLTYSFTHLLTNL